MKNYYRVMLGKGSQYAAECLTNGFIGADFGIEENLNGKLPEDWREFNHAFVPKWEALNPGKSRIAAGLACGCIWTIAKGIKVGDVILSPDGTGVYRVGEVISEYVWSNEGDFPHQRNVRWFGSIPRVAMSEALRNSAGSIGTVSTLSKHAAEIESLLQGQSAPAQYSTDENVEDPVAFTMEKYLEHFLVANWAQTDLGKEYDIYQEDGEILGQQYPSDTGPMDILAISKDKKTLLIVELKKGRASDAVVGQVLRYMGFAQQELAAPDQVVRGVIIALEDDLRLRRALAVAPNIEFFRYQISFKLVK
ncbi:MAG: endonuclease NucS [Formivibrio sp.]|nr:endonuclease NucS [Formivibrio sp.]